MATTVFSSNRSNVQVEGETIDGLQALAFRVVTEQDNVRAIGVAERVGVVFGLRVVQGELTIRSANFKLDGLLKDQTSFQLVANLKQDDKTQRKLSFDECYVLDKDFNIGAGGSSLTTYRFTATRLVEA